MNAREERDQTGPSYPRGDLESPFLEEELFLGETEPGWEAHLAALETESPYLYAFEQDALLEVEPASYRQEVAAFDLYEGQATLRRELWEGEIRRTAPGYIRWVQQALNRVLGTQLSVDGIIGTQTRRAIRRFQEQQGLAVDGIVGRQTEAALIAAGAGQPPTGAAPTVPIPAPSAPTSFVPVAVEDPGGGRIRDKRDPVSADLVTVTGVGGRSIQLHRLAADAWRALVQAARREGLAEPLLLPTSGYRSSSRQAELFRRAVARYGSTREARKWVAPPGGSAHQSGRAIDFYLGGRNSSRNVANLSRKPAYLWLVRNAQQFGFYPYEREPWHWEYNPPAKTEEWEEALEAFGLDEFDPDVSRDELWLEEESEWEPFAFEEEGFPDEESLADLDEGIEQFYDEEEALFDEGVALFDEGEALFDEEEEALYDEGEALFDEEEEALYDEGEEEAFFDDAVMLEVPSIPEEIWTEVEGEAEVRSDLREDALAAADEELLELDIGEELPQLFDAEQPEEDEELYEVEELPTAPRDGWVVPADVRAAGEAQTVPYDDSPLWDDSRRNCTGITAGAQDLRRHLLASFRGISRIGGYNCRRNSASPHKLSMHGTGRALDIMIPTVGGRANSAVGDPIANWLVQNASRIGVQYLIWNRVRWSGHRRRNKFARYTGPSPHINHIHVELNLAGAQRRTPWFADRPEPTTPARSSTGIDLGKAVRANRVYGVRLGWQDRIREIARLLGVTSDTPSEEVFANAVATWQRRHGLSVDGIIGPNTWRRMQAALRVTPPSPSATARPPSRSTEPAAEAVRFAQRVLNATGGERLAVDGDLGPLTRAALERFRRRYNLGAGGVLDDRTQLALAQRALEEIRQQSLFGQFGVLDGATREALIAFKSERGLGNTPTLDAATRVALANTLARRLPPNPTRDSPVRAALSPRVINAVERYRSLVEAAAAKYDVDSALIRGVMAAESGGNKDLVAKSGYTGLMQAGKGEAHKQPATSIDAGAKKLRDFRRTMARVLSERGRRYDRLPEEEQLRLLVLAYNAGPVTVAKALQYAAEAGSPGSWLDAEHYKRALLFTGAYSLSQAATSCLEGVSPPERDAQRREAERVWRQWRLKTRVKKEKTTWRKLDDPPPWSSISASLPAFLVCAIDFKHRNSSKYAAKILAYRDRFQSR